MKNKVFITLAVLVGISLGVAGFQLVNGKSSAGTCNNKHGQSYSVMIMDGKVEPAGTIHAKLCDTVTFTNMDKVSREIAFGQHEDHLPYDGVSEKVLNNDQAFTITLNQPGTYHWHDHIHDEVEGFFEVSK